MPATDFTLSGPLLLATLVIIAAAALLIGAGLGYYSASKDLRDERARAWDLGHLTGATTTRWAHEIGTQIAESNPYRPAPAKLAPVPAMHRIPTPLFDQDAEVVGRG